MSCSETVGLFHEKAPYGVGGRIASRVRWQFRCYCPVSIFGSFEPAITGRRAAPFPHAKAGSPFSHWKERAGSSCCGHWPGAGGGIFRACLAAPCNSWIAWEIERGLLVALSLHHPTYVGNKKKKRSNHAHDRYVRTTRGNVCVSPLNDKLHFSFPHHVRTRSELFSYRYSYRIVLSPVINGQ